MFDHNKKFDAQIEPFQSEDAQPQGPRTIWKYDRQTRESALKRKLLSFEFDEALIEAKKGSTDHLCELLRSDAPLMPAHREAIADLIYRRFQLKKQGRPPGPTDQAPRAATIRCVEATARHLERLWHHKNPDKRKIPTTVRVRLLDAVLNEMGDEGCFSEFKVAITKDEILDGLRRGKRNRKSSSMKSKSP